MSQPDELPGVGAEALIDNAWERMRIKYNDINVIILKGQGLGYGPRRGFASDFEGLKEIERDEEREARGRRSRRENSILEDTLQCTAQSLTMG